MRTFVQASLFIGLFILAACSSPQNQVLRKVAVGMDKSDVLDIMGNPKRNERVHNQDRWAYATANTDDTTHQSSAKETYIYFADGKVTYIGPAEDFSNNGVRSEGAFKKISDPGSDTNAH